MRNLDHLNFDHYLEAYCREYRDWQDANPRRTLFAFPGAWFRALCKLPR